MSARDNTTFKGLDLWNKLEHTDKAATKAFSSSGFNGTAVDPVWSLKRVTEQLGPVGFAWGWHIVSERLDRFGEGKSEQVIHTAVVRAWFRQEDGSVREVEHIGQTKAAYWSTGQNARYVIDENHAKKSVTDALSKIMMSLGASADVWMGRFDGNKYAELSKGFQETKEPEPATTVPPDTDSLLLGEARGVLRHIPKMDADKLVKLKGWLSEKPNGAKTNRWQLIAALDRTLSEQIGEARNKRVAELESQAERTLEHGPPPSRQDGQPPRRRGTPEEETNEALAASQELDEVDNMLLRSAGIVLLDLEETSDRDTVTGTWKWLNSQREELGTTPFDRLGKAGPGARDLRNRLQALCQKKAEALGVNLRSVPAA